MDRVCFSVWAAVSVLGLLLGLACDPFEDRSYKWWWVCAGGRVLRLPLTTFIVKEGS